MARLDENGLARLSSHIKTALNNTAPANHAHQHMCSDTLTWDGDPTGMTVADFPIENWTFVHVSDATPSIADVVGRAVFAQYADSDGEQTEEEMLVDNNMIDQSDGCFLIQVTIMVVPHDNATVEVSEGENALFPKKGIYFALFDDGETHMHIAKLTIPGHNLIGGTDPITPEMISAAPKVHAPQHQSPNVILWDGDETGHAVVTSSENPDGMYVHVSDVVPTEDEIHSRSAFGGISSGMKVHLTMGEDEAYVMDNGLVDYGVIVIATSDNITDTESGFTFTKKGIYFYKDVSYNFYVSYFYISNATLTTPSDPLTAEMIGAAPVSHGHSAWDISGGMFGGQVWANNSNPNASVLRNSKLVSTEATPTDNGEIYWTYE